MLKNKGILSTYIALQHIVCSQAPLTNTSPLILPQPRARPSQPCRTYARAEYTKGPEFRDNMNWPCKKAHSTPPSPYEIFELEKGAVYTKHRFYELVKIYHPDRNAHEGSECSGISHLERLERYRLVIEAHEILSDPVKRRAYDSTGQGWADRGRSTSRHTRGYYSAATGKMYGYGPEHDSSPFGNATWEDWERWYRRSDNLDKQPETGTYMSSNFFASFVIILAVLCGVAQATRVGQQAGTLEEKARAFTAETHQFLNSRADELSQNTPASDDRVKHFLGRRDGTRSGLNDEEEAIYRKHFAGREASSSLPARTDPPD